MACSQDSLEEPRASSQAGCRVDELVGPTTPLLHWCPTLDKSRELAWCLLRTTAPGLEAKHSVLVGKCSPGL